MKKHEDNIQKAVIAWARWQSLTHLGIYGKLSHYLHHSPNGGYRSKAEGANFKLMGVQAGFPDLFLFIPKGGYHGLFLELKTPKGKTATGKSRQAGRLSDSQETMIERLNAMGYRAVVCYGYDETVQTLKDYLDI